jgi:iron complex transport system substrate-binding protein
MGMRKKRMANIIDGMERNTLAGTKEKHHTNTGMNKRMLRFALAMLLAFALAIVAACGDGNNSGQKGTDTGNNAAASNQESAAGKGGAVADDAAEEPAVDAEGTVYPLTVTDATGTDVVIEAEPQRIVSLVPSETEVLYAIGAGGQVAGVDDNSNYPAEVADKPRTGGMETNIEAVAGLDPDLVIANVSMNGAAIEELRKLGVVVYGSVPKTLDETIAHIEQVGVIVNKQAEAKAVADKMRADKQAVADKVKNAEAKRVYLEFSAGWSVGKGEFLDEIVTLAGGVNVAGDQQGWFAIDPEHILTSNPQVIIYPDYAGDTSIPDAIKSRPGWDQIDAVKNNQVIAVTNDPLVRVGPRLTDGLLEVAKAIHPELFD